MQWCDTTFLEFAKKLNFMASGTESSSGLSLAERLKEGSEEAWAQMLELYGPLVAVWCRRAGLSSADEADVAQNVFVSVHRAINNFDANGPKATFRGWLWTITRNAILQHFRKNAQPARGGSTNLQLVDQIAAPHELSTDEDSPSTVDDTTRLLDRALQQIKPQVEIKSWQAFWQTTVLGKNATDAGKMLDMKPAAVRQAKSRILRRLRRQLGDQF